MDMNQTVLSKCNVQRPRRLNTNPIAHYLEDSQSLLHTYSYVLQAHLAISLVAASDNIALIKCSVHHSVLRPLLTELLPIEGTCNLLICIEQIRNEWVIP